MRFALYLILTLQLPAQTLYEEDVAATKGNRDANWRQLTAYVERLETGDPRMSFARQIGFPSPGLALKGAPRIEKAGQDELGVYHRVWLPVGDNLEAHGLLLLPAARKGRIPLIIAQHGGGGTPELALFRGGANYHDMIRGALREGYAVWAPLIVMYPFVDRDHGSAIPPTVREDLDRRLRFLGTTLFALEITKLKLALDYLLKRPEIDPARVGFIGLSYGGFYAAYAAALEPRIRAVVASCSLRPWDPADPEVWKPTGRPTLRPLELIWNLVSPRPVQLQVGKGDKLLPVDGARLVAEKIRPSWAANPAHFDYQEFDGGHEWHGALAWPFLRAHLK